MNETLKIISERYSCRNFNGMMPDDKDLNLIAQAAIQSPSGINRQYWHIIMLKNKEIMTEIEKEGLYALSQLEDKSMYERMMSRGGTFFYNAPCMFVIAVKEAKPKGAELIDLGIAAQNIVLAATSLGLASVHFGLIAYAFAGEKGAEFKKKLKFPEGYENGMAVLVGYTDNIGAPHIPDQSKITVIE